MSNVASQPTPEKPEEEAPTPVAETKPAAAKRHRVLAPPPTAYMAAPPPTESSSKSKEPHGKMLYAYQATGSDEVTVEDGDDVVIVQADGSSRFPCIIPHKLTFAQTALDGCVFAPEETKVSFRLHM
jgi:hypothetical protein